MPAVGRQDVWADIKFVHVRVNRDKELRASAGNLLESLILGLFLKS
ncbi:MAG: hypothetical protein WCP86_11125 [bacterium]